MLVIWCLGGGLSLADTVDLTDELQNSLLERAITCETDLDEVRESVKDDALGHAFLGPDGLPASAHSFVISTSSELPAVVARRSAQEVLRIFRI